MELWTIWWIWISAALLLGIIEVLVPGFIFLGIAVGAGIMAVIVALPGELDLAPTAALFAVLSLASWAVLKRAFKPKDDQTRVIHDDINK